MFAGQCFGLVFHLKYNVSQGCYREGCSLEGCYKDRCAQRPERLLDPSCVITTTEEAAATGGLLIAALLQGQGPSQGQSDLDNQFHDCIRRNLSGQVSLEEIFFGGITFQGGMSDQVGHFE